MKRLVLLILFLAPAVAAEPPASPEQVVRGFLYGIANADPRALELFSTSATGLRAIFRDDIRIRCTEMSSLHVTRSEIIGEIAEVDTAAMILRRPRLRGNALQDLERRTFRLKQEEGAWRIISMLLAEEMLTARILQNTPNASCLMGEHPDLLGPQLVHRLVNKATAMGPRDFKAVRRDVVDVARALAEDLHDRAGLAFVLSAEMLHEDVTGAPSESRLERGREALRLAEETGIAEVIYVAGSTLADVLTQYDDGSREAERVFRRVLEYRESVRPIQAAISMIGLGTILMYRQDYAAAYPIFRDVLAIPNIRPSETANAEVNLGAIFEGQHDLDRALEHYRRAAAVAGPKPYEIGANLGLARVYRSRGQLEEARQAAEKALAIARETPLKGLIGDSFITLTEIQIARGETAGAEDTLKTALAYAREVQADRVELRALWLLGSLHQAGGRPAEALRLVKDAEAVWRKFDFPGWERYPLLMLSARAELALGNPDRALEHFREAIDAVESVRGAIAGGQRERVLYFEPFHAAYGEMVSLLLERGRVEEALVYAERGKGRVLLDALGVERTSGEQRITAEQRTTRYELIQKLGEANRRVIVLRAADTPRAALESAVAEQRQAQTALDEFDSDLEARDPRLRSVRGAAAIVQPSDLGALIARPDFAILEYVVHDGWTSLFVIERSGGAASVAHHRIAVTREQLERDVRAYADRLARRDLGYADASRALHDALLKPIAARLAGKRMLCIVPDGPLWHLPFESLLGGDGRFLVEDTAVFYVPSISIYREIVERRRHERATDRTLVAFGNPMIAEARERVAAVYRGADLGPLPDAEAEAKSVGRIWGPDTAVYVGRDAREDTAKREMGAARIVHFAAHGLFDDSNPMFSQIVLARGSASPEDGVLQAWELMHLDIAADLVVLSACETARGRVGAGEGLIGMSWALFAGGCPSTVATHWKVGSAAAGKLMVAFHRRLAQNASKADALRAAQLGFLRDRATAHPFYWAGFVLIGAGS